jgi:alkane 1-monooxygenase
LFRTKCADGSEVCYTDRKRCLWLIGLASPFIPVLSILLYFAAGGLAVCLTIPLVYTYLVIPFLDGVLGEDRHNPPEAVVPLLAADRYYLALLYVDVVLLYACFAVSAWFVGTQELPSWAFVVVALSAGLSGVDALTVGHELGHKGSRASRLFSQAALALVAYGHFRIEHNRGHHVHVATPEDSASARMGESVYRFALRELPGAIRRGWTLERRRLAAQGIGRWSIHNEVLVSWLTSAGIAVVLVCAFGPVMLAFLAIHHAQAWYGLTQANYVEHYGLLREKLPNGRYEPAEPRHSWNTNHIFSNLLLFHLQRHSDHHAHSGRPYQALRDWDGLPRLPSGYPGCFGLAAIPRLWFEVMDPKLIEWAGGDLGKINIDPARRAEIHAKYGDGPASPATASSRDGEVSGA